MPLVYFERAVRKWALYYLELLVNMLCLSSECLCWFAVFIVVFYYNCSSFEVQGLLDLPLWLCGNITYLLGINQGFLSSTFCLASLFVNICHLLLLPICTLTQYYVLEGGKNHIAELPLNCIPEKLHKELLMKKDLPCQKPANLRVLTTYLG